MKDGTPCFHAGTQKKWRSWLEKNHESAQSIWLIIDKKSAKPTALAYPEAVDEALCFGWIDSVPKKRDEHTYYQFFAKRNPKSNWSAVNKAKIALLKAAGKLAPAGLASVEAAKASGTWNALDHVDRLEVPADMQAAFDKDPVAFGYWEKFPPSARRGILEWIFNAKTDKTRIKRIEETVSLARRDERANQFKRSQ